MTLSSEPSGTCLAVCYEGVVTGSCVVLGNTGKIIYAGPILGSPIDDDTTVLLSTEDFTEFMKRQEDWVARQVN